MVRYTINVHGHVQGVGFRFYVQQTALALDLQGWVKNMTDGTVFVDVQGDKEKMRKLLDALKKGNRYSKIDCLDIQPQQVLEDFEAFEILY